MAVGALAQPAVARAVPTAPAQPPSGPGGADYVFDCVRSDRKGSGATAYTRFVPDCPRPGADLPDDLPVVVFLHGFGITDPAPYRAWIDHITRRGAAVVFPVYQATLLDYYQTANAAVAVRHAIAELDRSPPGNLPPIAGEALFFVGHSAGGGIAVNLAALAGTGEIPAPRGVLAVEPAVNLDPAAPGEPDEFGFVRNWTAIGADTDVWLVVGRDDTVVGDETAWRIWPRIEHLGDRRSWVRLETDRHGVPPLVASHLVPLATRTGGIPGFIWRDPHDYLLWAMLDTLMSCGDEADACAPPLEPGTWSDGVPITPATRDTDGGATVPRIPPNSGNQSGYQIFKGLESFARWCPYLNGLCGTPPE